MTIGTLSTGETLELYAGGMAGRATSNRENEGVWRSTLGVRTPVKTPIRVLLVEDDDKLANSVCTEVELEGCSAVRVGTAEDALRLLSQSSFDVVLLDCVLPGKSGVQLLQWMRANGIDTPVIMVTGRGAISDRILGLESGADDYLVKPFSLPELSARIRALARRNKPGQTENLKCADLEIDVKSHTATRAGVILALTFREFEILEYLGQNLGHVVSREMLARDIWKETNRYTPIDNVINVHMARLRQKVDGDSSHKLLHTVRRVGFILREQVI